MHRRVPVARVIAGSLAAGIVTALVLTLVVFPGATESVITGSILSAFGLGWAMMAALSVRFTDQPQRWTAVPAVVMGVSGVGLMVGAPQNATLTALNWVWPPAMLALAVWMFVQMRRDLHGKGRWLLTPVLVVLAATTIGATVENVAEVRIHQSYPAPGKLYDVGGRRLHIDCEGQRRSHRGAVQRPRRDLGHLGPHHRRRSARRPGSAPTTAPARGGATTPAAPRTASRRPATCTPCSPQPANTARTSWPGTPPAAPTH